jgi:hypothetical protein
MSKKTKEKEIVEIAMEEPIEEITEETEIIKEEPKPAVKTEEFIEIKTETLLIKIPKNEKTIQETINILKTFISKPVEMAYESPIEQQQTYETPEVQIRPQQPMEIRRQPQIQEEEQMPLKSNEIVAVNPQERFIQCPICQGKVIRERVQQLDDAITQVIRCKDKRCGFERKYVINL